MTKTPTPSTPRRIVRLFLAVALVLPCLVVSLSPSRRRAPTEEEVNDAKAQVERLGHDLEIAIEAYNEANYQLSETQKLLADAKARMDAAMAEADAARDQLSDRAAEAYTGMGSQLDVLLEAQDFSSFSDRLTFMGAIAEATPRWPPPPTPPARRPSGRPRSTDGGGEAQAHVETMAKRGGPTSNRCSLSRRTSTRA